MTTRERNRGTSSSSSKGGGQNRVYGYVTANSKSYCFIKEERNEMKNNPTQAEALLWDYLRKRKTGHRIRRQHIIHNFVADFVCLNKKLIIEVDGKIHDHQKEYDKLRTDLLNQLGYEVIRFTNENVLNHPKIVVQKIKDYLDNKC